MESRTINNGLYVHYKGNYYITLFEGTHTETGEPFIVYYAVKDKSKVWIRPREMFFSTVEWEGKTVPRFKEVIGHLLKDDDHDL